MTLRHVLLSVQPKLLTVIDKMRGKEERCAFIEKLLLSAPPVKRRIAQDGIKLGERPGRGRPSQKTRKR